MVGFRDLGSGPEALLQVEGGAEETWLKPGADIGGWTLTEIDADRAHIRSGDTEITIQMYE